VLLVLEVLIGKCLQLYNWTLIAGINDDIFSIFIILFNMLMSTLVIGMSIMHSWFYDLSYELMSCISVTDPNVKNW
jgi:hypothetical protein